MRFAVAIPVVLKAVLASLTIALPAAAQRDAPACEAPAEMVTCSSSEHSEVAKLQPLPAGDAPAFLLSGTRCCITSSRSRRGAPGRSSPANATLWPICTRCRSSVCAPARSSRATRPDSLSNRRQGHQSSMTSTSSGGRSPLPAPGQCRQRADRRERGAHGERRVEAMEKRRLQPFGR
jgi:hypothetical protein